MSIEFQRLVVSSIPVIIGIYYNFFKSTDQASAFPSKPVDFNLPQIQEYDFIIVGAGCAGAPLANKLSMDFRVLLLESGGDPIPLMDVPATSGYIVSQNPAQIPNVYGWTSIKQPAANLDAGGLFVMAQGKSLGGGHTVNALVYNRGHPNGYNNWARMTGDSSWTYENLRPFFKMSENFWDEENLNGELGVGGPISIVEDGDEFAELHDTFIQAGKELGHSTYQNSNGPQTPGFGKNSRTIQFGRRSTVYKAFLEPILNRTNLDIVRYAEVSKVDIDEQNTAVGVFYTRHGVENYAKAKLEVILSAGAMNSPMILLRSGIGPAEQLKSIGIPVKSDLPVGQNFQCHPQNSVCGKFTSDTKDPLRNFGPKDVQQFLKAGTGFLTSSGSISLGFIVSSSAAAQNERNWPDIQVFMSYSSPIYSPQANGSQICINAQVSRPRSLGSITLDPANVLKPGIWNPRYLENERDVMVMVEGMKIASKLFATKAFQAFGVSVSNIPHPACKDREFGSDAYWACYVRRITKTTRHAAGTCKMGSSEDVTAVVDTRLQVKGIRGLRVIDNSIHPVITNSNTMAPAIMIGQKGAHMVISKYRGLINQNKP